MKKIGYPSAYRIVFLPKAARLAVAMALWAFSWLASRADEALAQLLSSPAIDSARTSVLVCDLSSGQTLASHLGETPLIPASVMKCVTTCALATGMSYSSTLKTKVDLCGSKEGETFRGSMVITGCGDPSLGDGRHEGQPDFIPAIISALRKRGIKALEGEIRIDDSLFTGPAAHPTWAAADLSQAYGTGCHAFNFEGNAAGKKAVEYPANLFRGRLIASLSAAGIGFEETDVPAKGKAATLLEYDSPCLGDLMRSCMFRSDNLYAESFMRLFGVLNGTDGSAASSAMMMAQYWEALSFDTQNVEIVDGSGLSRSNRLTANFLGDALRWRADDPEYVSFFPLVGEEGTVKSFLKDTPLQGRIALKTGSMSGIQSYAGYVLGDGCVPTHVIVVMANDLKDRSAFRAALRDFLLSILGYQEAPN